MRLRFLRTLLPALVLTALPVVSSAGVFIGVSVNVPPPPLPVYVQPAVPQPGFIWVPGYWAWGPYGYYWVPGTWVLPPEVGLLWTPGWWGWDADGDDYVWNAGYWGPQVGFYGGIDYGFGYYGEGFVGGYWQGGVFLYNRAVVNVGPTIVNNVYYRQVYHPEVRHVSFNGGRGGIRARPTRMDLVAARERRSGFTPAQRRQESMARGERTLRANFNHGRPPIAATVRPAEFHGRGAVGARSAGGPMRFQEHAHAPQMRSDRPSWASGQGGRSDHQAQRGSPREHGYRPPHAQPQYGSQRFRSQQPERRAPQRFQSQQPERGAPQRFQSRPPERGAPQRFQSQQPERGAPWSQDYRPAQPPRAMPEYSRPQRPQSGPRGGRNHNQERGGRQGPPENHGRGPGRWR